MGTNITSAAGICVHQPRSTNIAAFLEYLERPVVVMSDELDGETHAAHPSTDDKDIGIERHGEVRKAAAGTEIGSRRESGVLDQNMAEIGNLRFLWRWIAGAMWTRLVVSTAYLSCGEH